jgi:hypothetical protein
MVTFHPVPPVVLSPRGIGRLDIDLLPRALADVPDPEVAGLSVERVPPRIAQPVGPDLGSCVGATDERIVLGDPVGEITERRRMDRD